MSRYTRMATFHLDPLFKVLSEPPSPRIHEPNAWKAGVTLKVTDGIHGTIRKFLVLDDRKPGSAIAVELLPHDTRASITRWECVMTGNFGTVYHAFEGPVY